MKWSSAKKYCESIGGHLVTITSEGEQKQIVKQLKKMKKNQKNNYWIGAKQSNNGDVKWVTKEKFQYSNWATGQPDRSNEDCIMIYTIDNPYTYGDDSYLWNDLVNEGIFGTESWFGLDNFGFICEWDK
ncbi:MAG: C-type lectin domain-containing protein [Eubacteriales bacterium]|nr:C-type lectin domain-containing protein [Eubacteriales bacterium]